MGANLGTFWCFSPDIEFYLLPAYEAYIRKHLPEERKDDILPIARSCLNVATFQDYTEVGLLKKGPHKGKVADTNKPGYGSDLAFIENTLVPKEWILNNKEKFVEFWMENPSSAYFAFGGNVEFTHDQMNSLSTAHRTAGAMIAYLAVIFRPVWVDELYDFSDIDNLPPHIGSNHLGPNTYGPFIPLNRTVSCPIWMLTNTEAETMCISPQEAVYGTKTLKRLEVIKKKVDPNQIFDCFRCIGNKVQLDDMSLTPPPSTSSSTGNKSQQFHNIVLIISILGFFFM